MFPSPRRTIRKGAFGIVGGLTGGLLERYVVSAESPFVLVGLIVVFAIIGMFLDTIWRWVRDLEHPQRKYWVIIGVLVLLCVWLGWSRIQSKFSTSKTIVEMLPEEVLALAHRDPHGMKHDTYELWKALTPCLKLQRAGWMFESDAVFEVREAIKKSTRREVNDRHARNSMKARVQKGLLNVYFRRVDEGDEDFRKLPVDSIDIVFEINPYDKPVYVRRYWSDDICFIEWE